MNLIFFNAAILIICVKDMHCFSTLGPSRLMLTFSLVDLKLSGIILTCFG